MADEIAHELAELEALAPMDPVETQAGSVEATIESNTVGGTESTCNTTKQPVAESSDPENLNSLKQADELMEKGDKASKDQDYAEASDCYSRALEIRSLFSFQLGFYGFICLSTFGCDVNIFVVLLCF